MIENCFKCNVPMKLSGYLYTEGQAYGTEKLKCPNCGKEITKRQMFENERHRSMESKTPSRGETNKPVGVGQQQGLQPKQNKVDGKTEHRRT
jgi:hypothetical protein